MPANITNAPPPPPEPPHLGKDSDNAKAIRKALDVIELNQKWSNELYDWANDVYTWSQSIDAWRLEINAERNDSAKKRARLESNESTVNPAEYLYQPVVAHASIPSIVVDSPTVVVAESLAKETASQADPVGAVADDVTSQTVAPQAASQASSQTTSQGTPETALPTASQGTPTKADSPKATKAAATKADSTKATKAAATKADSTKATKAAATKADSTKATKAAAKTPEAGPTPPPRKRGRPRKVSA